MKENTAIWASARDKELLRAADRRRQRRNPDSRRNTKFKQRYGITLAEYNVMLSEQKGNCAICGDHYTETSKSRLCVDHDHDTLKVRQLLCASCNSGLGHFRESLDVLLSAMSYLQRHK